MMGQYCFFNMLKIYRDNKHEINAYFKGQTIECYTDDQKVANNVAFALFGGIWIFMIIFAISAAIWVWAVVVTIRYWAILPTWAQVVAVIGLLPSGFGPIITLIAVYVGKGTNSKM